MKIDYIISPYNHFYREIFKNYFDARLINPFDRDQVMSMPPNSNKIFLFADRMSLQYIVNSNGTGKNIIFFRRHELYDVPANLVLQSKHKFFKVYTLNSFLQNKLKLNYGIDSDIEKNYINEDIWVYAHRKHGDKIAWVGEFKDRKAPDYIVEAAQYYEHYQFHCAVSNGPMKQLYLDFITNYGLKNVFIYEDIDSQEKMNDFLNDKNYLLTTSISEGLPNCVLEALAKGIKPIIRNYPGNMFNEFTYGSLVGIQAHLNSQYNSFEYRELITNNYGLNQFLQFRDKIVAA